MNVAVLRKPNIAAITLAIMYWDACRSIAQAQIAGRDVPSRISHMPLTSSRLVGEFRDHVHKRLRLEIRI